MAFTIPFDGYTDVIMTDFEGFRDQVEGEEAHYRDAAVAHLRYKSGEVLTVTCWSLTEEEQAEVARTGVVWLGFLAKNAGEIRFPHCVVLGERPDDLPSEKAE